MQKEERAAVGRPLCFWERPDPAADRARLRHDGDLPNTTQTPAMNDHAPSPAAPRRLQTAVPEQFAQSAARLRAKRPLRNRQLQQIAADLGQGRIENAEKAVREFV